MIRLLKEVGGREVLAEEGNYVATREHPAVLVLLESAGSSNGRVLLLPALQHDVIPHAPHFPEVLVHLLPEVPGFLHHGVLDLVEVLPSGLVEGVAEEEVHGGGGDPAALLVSNLLLATGCHREIKVKGDIYTQSFVYFLISYIQIKLVRQGCL